MMTRRTWHPNRPRARAGLALGVLLLAVAGPGIEPGRAQDWAPSAALEERLARIVALPLEREARNDEVIAALVSELRASPEDPLAELILLRLQSLSRPRGARELVLTAVEKILDAGVASPFLRELYRAECVRLRASFGEEDPRATREHRSRFVTQWHAIGPFGVRGADTHDWRFAVEHAGLAHADLDLERRVESAWGPRSWTALGAAREGAELDPATRIDLRYGAAYAVAQVEIDEPGGVLLELACGDSFRLWWNGAQVLAADRLRGDERILHRRVLPAAAGANRILLKLAGVGGTRFSLRLHRADGSKLAFAPFPGPVLPAVERVDPGRARPFPDALDLVLAKGDPSSAHRHAAEGWLRLARGERMRSLEAFRRAFEAAPGSPDFALLLGAAYGRAAHLPDTWRRNQARDAYRRALELDPACVAAGVWLAVDQHRQGDPAAAFASLRELAERAPWNVDAELLLAELARSQRWDRERAAHLARALHAAPDDPEVQQKVAEWHLGEGRPREALAHYRRSLEANAGQDGVRERLASLHATTGDRDRARQILRRRMEDRPAVVEARLDYASFLADGGRHEEAEAVLREGTERFPLEPRFLQSLGDLAAARGDRATAIERYRRLLADRPDAHRVREALVRLGGEPPDPYFDEFRLDTREILATERAWAAEFPRAASVALLDDLVLRFYEDGSSRLITHQIFLITSEEGIEQHGTMRPRGTLLELRTLRPDGEVLEPIALGSGEYTMPGLEIGAAVEWRYEERLPSLAGSPLRMPAFYFQDIEMKMPFVRSRYVVIEPHGLGLTHLRLNYPWEPEVIERGDDVVRIYDVVGLGQLKPEPGMPAPEENVPKVILVERRTWDEVHHEMRARAKAPVSPEIREVAAQWTEGKTGQTARARALYEAVNDWVRASSASPSPTHTLLERRGDRLPLYMALLEVEGIAYDYAQARRNPDLDLEDPAWEWVRAELFPNSMVRVRPDDGPPVWVVMAARNQPFGELPASLFGAPVWIVGEEGARIDYLPLAPEEEKIRYESIVDLYPGEEGFRAKVRVRFPAGVAAFLEERLEQLPARASEAVQLNLVQGMLPGTRLVEGRFEGPGASGEPFQFVGEVASEGSTERDGRNLLAYRMGFNALELVSRFATPGSRTHPFLVEAHDFRQDLVRVHTGEAFHVVTLPRDLEMELSLGSYELSSRVLPDRVEIRRSVRFRPARIEAGDYDDLMRRCREIDDREADRIWLLPVGSAGEEGEPAGAARAEGSAGK